MFIRVFLSHSEYGSSVSVEGQRGTITVYFCAMGKPTGGIVRGETVGMVNA